MSFADRLNRRQLAAEQEAAARDRANSAATLATMKYAGGLDRKFARSYERARRQDGGAPGQGGVGGFRSGASGLDWLRARNSPEQVGRRNAERGGGFGAMTPRLAAATPVSAPQPELPAPGPAAQAAPASSAMSGTPKAPFAPRQTPASSAVASGTLAERARAKRQAAAAPAQPTAATQKILSYLDQSKQGFAPKLRPVAGLPAAAPRTNTVGGVTRTEGADGRWRDELGVEYRKPIDVATADFKRSGYRGASLAVRTGLKEAEARFAPRTLRPWKPAMA